MKPSEIDTTEIDKILVTLDVSSKYDLGLAFVEATIPVWENYAKNPDDLSYYDGVGNHFKIEYQDESGNLHSLEKNIISKAVEIVKEEIRKPASQEKELQRIGIKLNAHSEAIDIWDAWQPFEAEVTLLASHNLVQLYQGKFKELEETKLDLIIRQAVKALVSAKIKTINEIENLLRSGTFNKLQRDEPDQAVNNLHS